MAIGRFARRIVKDALLAICVLITSPLWLSWIVLGALHVGDRFFLSCGQFLSLVPGLAGVFLRRAFYVMSLERCARDCYVEFGTWFSHPQARLGRGIYIGARCTLGMCEIGDGTLIGSNVDLLRGRDPRSETLQRAGYGP
jgi:hypothetical protein